MRIRAILSIGLLGVACFAASFRLAAQDYREKDHLYDNFDKYFLAAARIYGAFLLGHCSQTQIAGTTEVSMRCSANVSTYLADLQGGLLQFQAERASRRVGEHLSKVIQQPLNNSPEAVQAAKNATQQCNEGIQHACVDLGYATLKGWGVPRNRSRADLLFRKACASGEPEGCGYLAAGYERDYPKEAAELYSKACFAGQGESPSCGRLAALNEQGRGVTKDLPLAAALFQRHCEKSENEASICEGWTRLSKQGVQPADIAAKFAPELPGAPPAKPPGSPK